MLHGTFTYIQQKKEKRILALVPDLQRHVLRAGSWLAETKVRGGPTYKLKGVDPGGDTLDPARNLFLKFRKRPPEPRPFATLILPLPRKITPLRIAEVPSSAFTPREELVGQGDTQQVPTLQVFAYDFKDENQLFLEADQGDGHFWEPVPIGGYINLHIFSAEDRFEEPSRSGTDFAACARLLGSDVKLNRSLPASPILNAGSLPPGVIAEETEDLAPRTLRMARLGRLVTQKGNANQAWYGNDVLGGDPEACGSPAGNDGN